VTILVRQFLRSCGWFSGVVLSLGSSSGCGLHYVASSAGYQAELLASGAPVEVVLASGVLSVGEEQRLRLFAEVKAFGARAGLSSSHNYDRYAIRWHRTIWNLSAAPPYALAPKTWWFPIVGRVPYLGFFTDTEVLRWREQLEGEGYEVYVREVGAYSTLGWFRDPVLPAMLRWDEARIAETVCHELAHATLWIPGSVAFNESFASVVGVTARDHYLAEKYGPDSIERREAADAEHDGALFSALLAELAGELDALYQRPGVGDDERAAAKSATLAAFPDRVAAGDFRKPERWARYAASQTWNNARLSQFRTYHTGHQDFLALLDASGGDLPPFIDAVRLRTRGAADPFAAIAAQP
jgi:predicted aminopeptidase